MSFRMSGPLDMRIDGSDGETALELIDRLDDDELADVIQIRRRTSFTSRRSLHQAGSSKRRARDHARPSSRRRSCSRSGEDRRRRSCDEDSKRFASP